jgi:hypothetical protein
MRKTKNMNPFILPDKKTPDAQDSEYDHKEFKQWVSDLPVGSVNETARALFRELKRQNCLDISPVERFEAIQLMLPTLGFVLEKMREHLVTKTIPLSSENKALAQLHLGLLVGVVVAYKTVMSQFHDESFTGHLMHKHTRAESLRRALYFLGEILLYEYSIYSASSKFVWQEIHGIYHYAVINELQLKEVDADGVVGGLTVDDIYKRILLLALADSGGLLKGEIKKISEALVDWLPEVALVPIDQKIPLSSAFVVDAAKDAPPYVASEADLAKVKTGWFLQVDELGQILEQKLRTISDKSKSKLRPVDLVPATLYSKLLKRWTPDIVSREERSEGYGAIDITYSLESLYWLFGGWKLQQDEDNEPKSAAKSDVETPYVRPDLPVEQDEFLINVDAELYAAITAESDNKGVQKEPDQETEDEIEMDFYNAVVDGEPNSEECTCVNKSRNGFCLTWSGEGEYKAHVGELIGVNSRDNLDYDSSWSLGVVRWIRAYVNGLMGFGIELFEGDIQAIKLDCHHDNGSAGESIPGFLQKRNGKIETLITKPFFYGDKDKLLLISRDGQVPVLPGQIVECTDAFMRFEVRFDSSIVGAKEDRAKRRSKEEDIFNNIWDEL